MNPAGDADLLADEGLVDLTAIMGAHEKALGCGLWVRRRKVLSGYSLRSTAFFRERAMLPEMAVRQRRRLGARLAAFGFALL
jgi:hypothetical protein